MGKEETIPEPIDFNTFKKRKEFIKEAQEEVHSLISEEEAAFINDALMEKMGDVSEEDFVAAIKWIEKTRLQYAMTKAVFSGKFYIEIDHNGEIVIQPKEGITL